MSELRGWMIYSGIVLPIVMYGGYALLRSRRRPVYTRRDEAPYLPHSLHVLAGSGQVCEVVLYAPPLGASLFAAFGLPPTGLIPSAAHKVARIVKAK
jgi:hypothetical protein